MKKSVLTNSKKDIIRIKEGSINYDIKNKHLIDKYTTAIKDIKIHELSDTTTRNNYQFHYNQSVKFIDLFVKDWLKEHQSGINLFNMEYEKFKLQLCQYSDIRLNTKTEMIKIEKSKPVKIEKKLNSWIKLTDIKQEKRILKTFKKSINIEIYTKLLQAFIKLRFSLLNKNKYTEHYRDIIRNNYNECFNQLTIIMIDRIEEILKSIYVYRNCKVKRSVLEKSGNSITDGKLELKDKPVLIEYVEELNIKECFYLIMKKARYQFTKYLTNEYIKTANNTQSIDEQYLNDNDFSEMHEKTLSDMLEDTSSRIALNDIEFFTMIEGSLTHKQQTIVKALIDKTPLNKLGIGGSMLIGLKTKLDKLGIKLGKSNTTYQITKRIENKIPVMETIKYIPYSLIEYEIDSIPVKDKELPITNKTIVKEHISNKDLFNQFKQSQYDLEDIYKTIPVFACDKELNLFLDLKQFIKYQLTYCFVNNIPYPLA